MKTKMLTKIMAVILTLCMILSLLPMSVLTTSAAGIGLDSLKDWKAWDLYTRGFNAAGNAIEFLGESTGNGDVAKVTSFINNTFFGGDTTDETLAALQNTCNEILETTRSVENIVNEINSKLSKSLINDSKKDCNDAWKEQVSNQFKTYDVATYNFSHVFDAYCRYLASASGVEIEGMQSGKTVEDYNNEFISELKKYYTNAYNGVKPPVVYESTLYEDAWMDTVLTGMVDALLSEMDPKSSVGVKGERFIDCVADCAFKSFPFSSEQAEYVDTAAQYQINYVTCVLMMYQDYAARRIEYIVEQDGFTDQYGTKISAEEWWNGYTDKNGNVVDGYYDEYYLKTFDNYNNTIEKFLTGDIYLTDAGVYTKLDKYVRDDSASVPNSSSKQNFTLTNDNYVNSYEAKSGGETQTCKAKYTSENMKFYKNAQVSIEGNELVFTPFYILNGELYNTNLSNFSKDVKEKGVPGAGSFQYYFTSCDYKNLKDGEYTDGTNIYIPVKSVDEVKSLVSENPYTAYYTSPYTYFSDYVNYGSGKDLYIILDGEVKSIYDPKPYFFPNYFAYPYFKLNQDLTYVDNWKGSTLSEYGDNKYTSGDLYALFLVPQNDELKSKIDLKSNNTSVLEISDCPTTDRSGNSIDTYNETDSTALSGERVKIKVSDKYSEKYRISGVKVQYHNDGSDPTKVTSEKVICENLWMSEFDYPVPYSNVTITVEVEKTLEPDVDVDGNYLIETYNQLLYVAGQVNDGVDKYVNGNYLLTKDIDCSGQDNFVPVGQTELYNNANPSSNGNWGFKGTFDGQGHVIKNLTIEGSSTQELSYGIFGTVSGTVKRLGIENLTYKGAGKDSRVGGIAGQVLQGGKITDCYVKNSSINTQVDTTSGVAGGVAGANYGGTVEDCYTYSVNITAGRAGGIVGDNYGDANNADGKDRPGTVRNCFTTFDNICSRGSSIGGEYHTHKDRYTYGRVAYLLNNEVTDGTQAWYQNIDNGKTPNDTPVLISYGNDTVYFDLDKYTNKKPGSVDTDDENTYVIKTYEDLCTMAERVNRGDKKYVEGSFILANDIVAPENSVFTPIGTQNNYFKGDFDGQGHTISGLHIDTYNDYVGLFGYCSSSTIENVGLIDCSVSGYNYVGGIVGYISEGMVNNCYSTGKVSGVNIVGGIAGCCAYDTKVNNCYNTGNVSCSDLTASLNGNIGGIVGSLYYGTVSNCYNTGTISGDDDIGGIVGDNSSTVTNCYNNGTLSGVNKVGGIVGYNNNGGKVSKSYNTGNVSGETEIGGIVGKNWRATLTDCYNIGVVSGNSNVAGIVGTSGNSTVKNTYYLNTSCSVGINGEDVGETIVKTAEQFASGEVAYLLNNGVTEGTQTWYQNIDNGKTADEAPVLTNNGDNTVYLDEDKYTNSKPIIIDKNEDGVFVIKTYEELCKIAYNVNNGKREYLTGSYILANDIVAPENAEFTPIGTTAHSFSGTFDGQGYTISGLYIESDEEYIGLFGNNNGTIKNVGVIDSYFSGTGCVGGVVGYNNYKGSVSNCYSTATVIGSDCVGGVVGYNYLGSVSNCYNEGKVSDNNQSQNPKVGGVVGEAYYGILTNCYNVGIVSSESPEIVLGGVVGRSMSSEINDCHNTGTVSAESPIARMGGIVGYVANGTLTNCYYLNTSCSKGVGENVFADAEVISKNIDEFKSGEVAYLLNNGVTDGTQAWYQNIAGENKDSYPVLDNTHNTVYKTDDSYMNGDLIGDINRDGVIDVTDLTLLGEYLVRKTVLTADEVTLGDVNGDGKTGPNDLLLMKAYVNQDDTDYANTGKYRFNTMPSDALLVGDVNFDGIVDTQDADLMAQFNVEMITLTDEQKKAGDIDLDGHISTKDMSEINKYLAFVSNDKPYTGNIGKYSYVGFDMNISGGHTSTPPTQPSTDATTPEKETVPAPDNSDANSSTSDSVDSNKTDNNAIQTGSPVNALILLSVLISGLVLMLTFRRYKNK